MSCLVDEGWRRYGRWGEESVCGRRMLPKRKKVNKHIFQLPSLSHIHTFLSPSPSHCSLLCTGHFLWEQSTLSRRKSFSTLNITHYYFQTHTLMCSEGANLTTKWPLWRLFISCWGLCLLLCQPSCLRILRPFVCEVLEVINICFAFSVGDEDPADSAWPLLNPQWVDPISTFPSHFFFWGRTPHTDTRVGLCGTTQDLGDVMLRLNSELKHAVLHLKKEGGYCFFGEKLMFSLRLLRNHRTTWPVEF